MKNVQLLWQTFNYINIHKHKYNINNMKGSDLWFIFHLVSILYFSYTRLNDVADLFYMYRNKYFSALCMLNTL